MGTTQDASDVTRTDKFALDEAVDTITDLPGVRNQTQSDVWATFRCDDATNFHAVLEAAARNRDVVVYKAEFSDKAVSIALEKFADRLAEE
jgi:hypothetical protein